MTGQLPDLPRPFVGIRPFERNERSIFFGRDRDARLICDKIFASRLTLFYGPSGVGKSSLLCTLVMPELEAQNARTFYYDAWSAEDPLEALKEELVDVATAAGVADAGAGAPTLANLVAMLNSVDGRTVVLILDQFEELLAPSHAQHHKRLRRELLRLVRARGPDVRVVLSLREEHLAALEPLREDVLEHYMSTYRLEMLDDADLRKAIQGPAAVFGVEWEPKLVEDLIKDLQSLGGGVVELPMLQLVCDQLWTARRNDPRLSVSLYEWLGKAPAILDAYVRSVMPSTVQGRSFTAKLMVALAPRSGFKAAYTPTDLAETCGGLPLVRASQELERLSQERILRTRRYKSSVLYELQHDALIPIIGKWRDEVMERDRERKAERRSRRRRVAVLLFVFLAFLVRQGWGPLRVYQRTSWVLSGLAQEVATRTGRGSDPSFEDIQDRYIKDPELLAKVERTLGDVGRVIYDADDYPGSAILAAQLEQYRDLVPQTYGREAAISKPPITADVTWPIILRHSTALKIDRASFNETWRTLARRLVELRGIPLPEEIDLQPTRELPRRLGHLLMDGGREPLELPAHDHDVFLREAGLTPRLQAFLDRIPPGERKGTAEEGGPWRFVPRWSLPVWTASETTIHDGHELAALLIMLEIQKAPDKFLSPVAVEYLLQRLESVYPETVKEARAARGKSLVTDLQEVLRLGGSLADLPQLLDRAATYPASTMSSEVLASLLVSTPGSMVVVQPILGNPRPRASSARMRLSVEQTRQLHGFERSTGWLPPLQKAPVTCFIGPGLQEVLLKNERTSSELSERMMRLQEELYRELGVRIPDVTFVALPSLQPNAFRFEILGEGATGEHQVAFTHGNPVGDVVDAYRLRAEALRERWVTAETVAATLRALPPDMSSWFGKQYSITDLKEMLRAVIRPNAGEAQQRQTADNSQAVQVPADNTLFPADWLLGSLVFWHEAGDRDLETLARHLQQTQRALDAAWQAAAHEASAEPEAITKGVAALEEGKPELAALWFQRALAQSPESAARLFLDAYTQHRVWRVAKDLRRACANPLAPRLTGELRLELDDYLTSLGQTDPRSSWERKIRLCQLTATPLDRRREQQRLAEVLVQKFSDPASWPAAEAAELGYQLMALADSTPAEKALQAKAHDLVVSAFKRSTPGEAALQFRRTLELCHQPGPHYQCPALLQAMASKRADPEVQLDWMEANSTGETEEELKYGLVLADKLTLQLATFDDFLVAYERVNLARASAHLRLAELGRPGHLESGERIAKGLAGSPIMGGKAHALLVRSATAHGRYDEAAARLEVAMKLWPRDPDLRLAQLSFFINSGNLVKALEQGGDDTAGAREEMFLTAVAQMMAGKEDWELGATRLMGSNDPRRQLLTLLLYARLGAEVSKDQHVLEDAWGQFEEKSWTERLEGGDIAVWYEMWVGYYAEKCSVPRERLFGPLVDDQTFDKSELRRLKRSRRQLACEASLYEALLAQTQGKAGQKMAALDQLMSGDCRDRFEQSIARHMLAGSRGVLIRSTHPMH